MNNYPMRHRISIKRKQFEKTGLAGSAPAQGDVGSVLEEEPAADRSLLRGFRLCSNGFILNHDFVQFVIHRFSISFNL